MTMLRNTLTAGVLGVAAVGLAWTQLGGMANQEWSTSGGDAQRSAWIRKDPLISKAAMATGKFGFLWKLQLNNQARQRTYFSNPALVGNAMGFKGFRSLTVLTAPSNTVFAVDNDFGTLYWDKHFEVAVPTASTAACPGGMTAAASRITNPNPASFLPRGPIIRSPYRGALGEPGAGAQTDAAYLPGGGGRANAAGRGAAPDAGRGGAAAAGAGRAGGRGRGLSTPTGAQPIAVLSSDGVLHFVSPVSAKELLKPVPFIPANANATDLSWVSGMVYTSTINECGGIPNGVWGIDPLADSPTAVSWKTQGGSVVGTIAFGSEGIIYAAIGAGRTADGGFANAVVALDPQTLQVKDWFTQAGANFVSTPVVFQRGGKDLLATASADGRIFLLDGASLGGADHKTPLQVTAAQAGSQTSVVAAGFASWEDESGVRWLLVPSTTGSGAITAYRLKAGATPSLEKVWTSREMVAPLPPIVVNGIVYAAASGEFAPGDAAVSNAERAKRSSPAVLYALDGDTGKEIWNSGKTMAAFVHGTGLSSSPGQVYLTTSDNVMYAFGMPYERQ